VAMVQVRTGSSPGADELLAWCRADLAGYKCPKQVQFVEEIPRNPMGKIDKRALRATFTADA
jgi:acyl-coenzyme A synthetase/AMP-(fatty) acid ligase